ncbi:MAG: LpxI family protein, partial [Hyphomicrobiaceae bacterium]
MTRDSGTFRLDDRACVGIVAGSGRLPVEIAEALVGSGRKVHIVAVDPAADEGISKFPNDRIALGQVGRLISILERNDCRDLIISGAIGRPDLRNLRTDFGFYRHLPRILSLMRGGDDAVLRRVIRFFEDQGFRVHGLAELAPELLVGVGTISTTQPLAAAHSDATLGYAFIRDIGDLDIGQAAVVRDGAVRAIEGAEGTDGLLRRLAAQRGDGPRDGILVKASKPQQDLRIDIPTIGPNTVENCVAAGLGGIAVEASRSVIVDRETTLRMAEQAGIVVLGIANVADD